MSRLPDDVIAEMQSVLDEMNVKAPPPNAFSLEEYYEFYVKGCQDKGIKEEFIIQLDGMRNRLDRMVKSGMLEKGLFSVNGIKRTFFWRADEK